MLKCHAIHAIPTPEGTAQIEVRSQIGAIHGRQPTKHFWLFEVLKIYAAVVYRVCECTEACVDLRCSVQQGEVVHQRFPRKQLADGDAEAVILDVPVMALTEEAMPPALETFGAHKSLYRELWRKTILLPLDRQPMPPVVL